MTPLRQRMTDAMLQRGYATSTQANYVKAIYGMAKYYRRDPAQYNAAEVQAYLLHMVKDRHVSFSNMNQTACAARFLYETVLGHDRETFHIPMAKVPVTRPELLSREEIARLFATSTNPVYRMILQTIYATGLRVFEACALRVRDIDSAADRMCIRVENGKGSKTRYTLLSPALLELLRAYVRQTRNREWLFCARGGRRPLSVKSAQRAYWGARDGSGIIKRGGVHTLRHAFATHLLEGGVDLVTTQRLMGHSNIGTTSRYMHLIRAQFRPPKGGDPLADALRQFGAAYLAAHALSTPQAKAWRAIVACRTAALGGQQLACDTCGHRHWQDHSCRHRCCPQCGTRAKDAWLQGQLAEVLPVP